MVDIKFKDGKSILGGSDDKDFIVKKVWKWLKKKWKNDLTKTSVENMFKSEGNISTFKDQTEFEKAKFINTLNEQAEKYRTANEAKIQELKETINRLSNEKSLLGNEIRKVTDEKNKLQEKILKNENKIKELEKKPTTTPSKELKKLKVQNDKYEDLFLEKEIELKKLREELEVNKKEKQNLQNLSIKISKEKEDAELERDIHSRAVDTLNEDLRNVTNDLQDLEKRSK